jgi:hypothetical protein
MSKILTLRCSALPLAFRCPASVLPSAVRINESHQAADAGTAVHELVRPLPVLGRIDWDQVVPIAQKYSADSDEVRVLCALAVKLWKSVAETFAGAMTEVELEQEIVPGVKLTGHADLLTVTPKVIRSGDWKGGRKDNDYSHQVKGYLVLSLLEHERVPEGSTTVLWIRDQDIENYRMTRDDAKRWIDLFVARVVEWDGVYRPGSHCAHCPRSHACEAANAMVRRDVVAIADKALVARAESEIELMTPAEIIDLYRKAELVVKYAERARAAIKAHVERHGDVVADGTRLTITTEHRREVDPLEAWPVLEALGLTDDDFARVIEIRLSRLEKLIQERALRGKKAEAVRQLGALLQAAGAITRNETRKLQERRE